MSPRNIILLVVAILIAAVTALAVRTRIQPAETVEQAEVAKVETQRILVVKNDIPPGSFVKGSSDLEWAEWPASSVQEFHIKEGTEDISTYDGAVARRTIRAGEAVTANLLIKPGAGGFLSAVLEPGKRAVSVAVSPTTGTAGFIFPGDRVDLIVTHRLKVRESRDAEDMESIVSETFIKDVRVVAVDQMLDNPENKAILAKTVTVEVSPEEAEEISVAEDMGKISFALRSIANAQPEIAEQSGIGGPEAEGADADFLSALQNPELAATPETENSFTRDSDISSALNPDSGVTPRILVIRGEMTEQREFLQDE